MQERERRRPAPISTSIVRCVSGGVKVNKTAVVIVDDHEIVRQRLRGRLSRNYPRVRVLVFSSFPADRFAAGHREQRIRAASRSVAIA